MKFALKVIKQHLADIWKQTQGVRYDVIAGRVAGVIGGIAGAAALVSPYVRFIPGRTGEIVAGGCAVIAMVAPRANKAAGLLRLAYGQKLPLFPALKLMLQTLLNGPSIVAQAKTAEADEAQKQKDAADELRVAQQVKTELTKLGISRSALSGDVPADLQDALDKALPPGTDKALPPAEQAVMTKPVSEGASSPNLTSTTLTSTVIVEDKAPVEEVGASNTPGGNTP